MANLWRQLKSELQGTVEDIREKGAAGALRDAVLDVRDIVADTGGAILGGVRTLVTDQAGPTLPALVLRDATGSPPKEGDEEQVQMPGGEVVSATVMQVDTVSMPPRARVRSLSSGDVLVVPILSQAALEAAAAAAARPPAAGGGAAPVGGGITIGPQTPRAPPSVQDDADGGGSGLLGELRSTVDELRERGAAGALLDAAELIGGVAGTACKNARLVADKTAGLLRGGEEGPSGLEEQPLAATAGPGGADLQEWYNDDSHTSGDEEGGTGGTAGAGADKERQSPLGGGPAQQRGARAGAGKARVPGNLKPLSIPAAGTAAADAEVFDIASARGEAPQVNWNGKQGVIA